MEFQEKGTKTWKYELMLTIYNSFFYVNVIEDKCWQSLQNMLFFYVT